MHRGNNSYVRKKARNAAWFTENIAADHSRTAQKRDTYFFFLTYDMFTCIAVTGQDTLGYDNPRGQVQRADFTILCSVSVPQSCSGQILEMRVVRLRACC